MAVARCRGVCVTRVHGACGVGDVVEVYCGLVGEVELSGA